jgi:hypothetical protein
MSADLRTIATFSDPIEAELVANRLDEEGIATAISGDATNSAFSGLGYMAGAIDILVPAAELERARTILADFAKEVEAKKHRPPHAITAAPPIAEMQDDAPDGEPPYSEEERSIQRAFVASIAGFFLFSPIFPVVHVYTLLTLLFASSSGKEVRSKITVRYYLALIICASSILAGVFISNALFVSPEFTIVPAAVIGLLMFLAVWSYNRPRK